MNAEKKSGRYQRMKRQLDGLLQTTDDPIARMATIASLLFHKMDGFFWVGFYRCVGGELIVGPYQGPLACQTLKEDTGVCWAVVNGSKAIIVEDVRKFKGHIACDSRTKSEVVVPCFDSEGNIFAVLDIDSTELNNFDETDAEGLGQIIKLI
ncbi:MAG: GAF domain-containing protein [Anaerohalosphaera sp.]|nr:GAF domain-containing protein [Anaerohalosphaera sp.]